VGRKKPPTCLSTSSKSSPMDVYFNKGSPKSSFTFSLPTMLPLKDLVSYQDEDVNEEGEGLNQFDPPHIFDDCGDEEILGVEDHGDEEILGFEDHGDEELLVLKELGEPLTPLSFCEKKKLAHKEEFHVSPDV